METMHTPDQPQIKLKIEKRFKDRYPWLEPWNIRVSQGMESALDQLFVDLQSILGPDPKLQFLHIVDEPVNEELYQRQLAVFSKFPSCNEVKLSACLHAVKQAIIASKRICKECGRVLLHKDSVTAEEFQAYRHLQLLVEQPLSCMRYFCPTCLNADWSVNQTIKNMRNRDYFYAQSVVSNDGMGQGNDIESPFEVLPKAGGISDKSQAESSIAVSSNTTQFPVPTVTVIRIEDLERLETDNKTGNRDTVERIKNLVKKIKSKPLEKRLTPVPENWRANCQQLVDDYPNFVEVITFLRNQMALSSVAGDRVLRFAPLLMTGGPGVGKSDFMLTIADSLNTPIEIINASNSQTGAALTGSEQYWGNTQTGTLFNTIVTGEVASPIICLDEIDKARCDGSYKALAALHQLLETKQARRYADLSVPELRFDASHILWMATANELEQIDKPIVDRFTVFQIAEPDAEQMRRIVLNQYRRFIDSDPAGSFFEPVPRPMVVDALCGFHPRQVRKTLQQCFGLAAYEERPYLTAEDVTTCTPLERKTQPHNHSGIGFLAPLGGCQ